MDWGKKNRLSRLMPGGRAYFLPIDHGYFLGPTRKLEKPGETIAPLLPYCDALFVTRGVLRACVDPIGSDEEEDSEPASFPHGAVPTWGDARTSPCRVSVLVLRALSSPCQRPAHSAPYQLSARRDGLAPACCPYASCLGRPPSVASPAPPARGAGRWLLAAGGRGRAPPRRRRPRPAGSSAGVHTVGNTSLT